MKNNATDNLSLKIVSFILALIIWVTTINVIRPIVTESLNVPIKINNEEEILKLNKAYLTNVPLNARVSYKVEAERESMIRRSDFTLYIDFNELTVTNELPVHVEVSSDIDKYVSNLQYEPKTIKISLTDATRTELPVKYKIKGETGEGYSIGDVILSPNIVYVSGSNALIDSLSNVIINIPVNKQGEGFSGKAKVHIIGKDGKEINATGLDISATEINYSVTVFTRANVALNAFTEGNPKAGFNCTDVRVIPSTIMLEGPRSVIENIYTIDLPAVNIDGLSEGVNYDLELKDILPAGTRCESIEKVNVNVDIGSSIIIRPRINEEETEESSE